MITELGHFCLILAMLVAFFAVRGTLCRYAYKRVRPDEFWYCRCKFTICTFAVCIRRFDTRIRYFRLFGSASNIKLPLTETVALQDQRCLG